MSRFALLLPLALALAGCTSDGILPPLVPVKRDTPLDHIQASSFPMAQDIWRVDVKGDGQVNKDVVERAALYTAADLTIKRGYDRFIVQSTSVGTQQRAITQTLTQTGEAAGVATNMVMPGTGGLVGAGSSAVIGGLDRVFTSYGGEIVVHMFKKEDTGGQNGLDAVETLNAYVNELKRPI